MAKSYFQNQYESLFAGDDKQFNKKLAELSCCQELTQLKLTESKAASRMFFFEGIGLEKVLIHGVTSFLSCAALNPLSDSLERRARSAKWVTTLAKRLVHLSLEGEINKKYSIKSTFESIKLAHNLIQVLVKFRIIMVVKERKTEFDILFDSDSKFNVQKHYQFNEEVHNFISDYELKGMKVGRLPSPLTTPSTIPPLDHQHQDGVLKGGLHHPLFSNSISDIMLSCILAENPDKPLQNNKETFSRLDFNRTSNLNFEEDSKALKSINYLQQVGWIYNLNMVKLLKNLTQQDSSDTKTKYKSLTEKIKIEKAIMHINLLKNQSKKVFYYPWFFDYRGRVYCSTIELNPQGDDLSRSLLMFSSSQKVNNEKILYDYFRARLKIKIEVSNELLEKSILKFNDFLHLAISDKKNESHSSLELKFSEFLAEVGVIETSTNVFLKERFTILALVLEFQHYWDTNGEWRIPIRLDATCNGQQHMSVILKDRKIAELTKVLESSQQLDFYQYVAQEVRQKISESGEIDLTVKEKILPYISRAHMKHPVMIAGYGAKGWAITEGFIEDDTFLPLSIWPDAMCTRKERKEQEKKMKSLPKSPSRKQKRDKYFFVKRWVVKSDNKEHKNFKKRGFYPLSDYNPKRGGVEIVGTEIGKIESRLYTEVLTYNQCLKSQEARVIKDIKSEKRKKIIELIVDQFQIVQNKEFLLSQIKELLEERYEEYIEEEIQEVFHPETWFSFPSKSVGMTISFVIFASAKKSRGVVNSSLKRGIGKFETSSFKDLLPEGIQTVNIKLFEPTIAHPSKIKRKLLPSFIHSLDASHLHLIVDDWFSNHSNLGPIVTNHDDFGMHPNDVEKFKDISRQTFIQLHSRNPFNDFMENCGLKDFKILPIDDFDIEDVSRNMFKF